MKKKDKLDAINKIMRISCSKNIDFELAKALFCDECDYCEHNVGRCILQDYNKILDYKNYRRNA